MWRKSPEGCSKVWVHSVWQRILKNNILNTRRGMRHLIDCICVFLYLRDTARPCGGGRCVFWGHKLLCRRTHTACKWRASLLNVSVCVSWGHHLLCICIHTTVSWMVLLRYETECEWEVAVNEEAHIGRLWVSLSSLLCFSLECETHCTMFCICWHFS